MLIIIFLGEIIIFMMAVKLDLNNRWETLDGWEGYALSEKFKSTCRIEVKGLGETL